MDKLAAALTIKPLKGEKREKEKGKSPAGGHHPTASDPLRHFEVRLFPGGFGGHAPVL